jgi:hypothetical protein
MDKRKARVRKSGYTPVASYLPSNYRVTGEDEEWIYIEGSDSHGWTLDDYVIPRLASGLMFAEEI